MPLTQLKTECAKLKNPAQAKVLQRFFKTGKGQYGEGDVFLGIMVPEQRRLVAKHWQALSLSDLKKLLQSKTHEHRLIALLVLVKKYQQGSRAERAEIYRFYLSQTERINNWDLVDLSAPNIVGEELLDQDRKILYRLAKSPKLWERRIAMLATFAFIKKGESRDALAIAKTLLNDDHDLIHKAAGWMLREVGKRCGEKTLLVFLDTHSKKMPRTMLRYAIERLPESLRKRYLKK